MQIRAEPRKSALPICNYSQILYQFLTFTQNLKRSHSPLADAIIDRIAHDSYRINITSIDAEHDISMREVYGLDKTLRE